MHSNLDVLGCRIGRLSARVMVLVALVSFAPPSSAEIIWNGDFSTGNFLQYHSRGNPAQVTLFHIPDYGKPINYGGQPAGHYGNGDLLSLVARTARTVNGIYYPLGPVRGTSDYAAKFTMKSDAGGGVEPQDCDPNTSCNNRRSNLQQNLNWNQDYDALPMLTERWLSFSIFVPEDFSAEGSGFGPVLWGSKAFGGSGPAWLQLEITDGSWLWVHRPSQTDSMEPDWWHHMRYTATSPNPSYWTQGLEDYPDVNASQAALANLNRGRWTDFIIHFKSNHTLPVETNDGFIDIYMRAQGTSGEGPWVHILHILPKEDIKLGGENQPERWYDRVIGRDAPQGFTSAFGLYSNKDRIWHHSHNMVVYFANKKVGSSGATFADMSPDGSAPILEPPDATPRPPEILHVD